MEEGKIVSLRITEVDLFYISYDEPQKEEYWAKVQEIAPWAKRIDGVKGFDTAHKECARQSETDRFITIDGDNIVYPEFFDLQIDIPEKLQNKTLSWAGRNVINGLCYGNGGVKLWTKEFVLNMRTHENATRDEEKVDFCWDNNYVQLNGIYSDTCPNGSPFQAFRAGFREGVKMTLDRGVKAGDGKIDKYLHEKNYRRLLIWATIGADVENGDWAIFGTRLGIFKANLEPTFDIAQISDYDWFKKYFDADISQRFIAGADNKCPRTGVEWNSVDLRKYSASFIQLLNRGLGMTIADMSPEQSAFFKSVYEPPKRTLNPLATEIEVDRM